MRLFIDRRQTAQNNGGFGSVGFADLHQLEAARQGGIFFEVFFVLAPGGGGDGFQLAARQRRFEQVGDIQPALLVARANQGMCFVDKQNDRHRGGNDLRHQPFETFFEFTLHRRPGLQCAQVKGHDIGVFQLVRHLACHDAQRQPFNQCAFAHARFAHHHRVVFTAAAENVDHQVDFVVAAQYRVKPAVTGVCGHVFGIAGKQGVRGVRHCACAFTVCIRHD
ncbi:Protein of uncharacterised function (DUF3170) [Shigella sonnei]|nr:Protein of uncharacterised function (DUF3170) [Shigella sonnei]CSE38575.1 Protein of uncharacterised function (DUF3170) [Shigella sonnei]CSE43233.1 Protein of uncharacterised function (DUF3170) [Shigella sonnei]CSE44916.1 Protein of uncharacterised function (DUF3170) [Shigella sonnei]CSE58073.1 Protein of uncharacterised function (DUF3170) [Shigella sonnei]